LSKKYRKEKKSEIAAQQHLSKRSGAREVLKDDMMLSTLTESEETEKH
jgi:hypothetical protein